MAPQPSITQQLSGEEMENLVWTDPSEGDNEGAGEILFQVWTEPSPRLSLQANNIRSNRHHARSVPSVQPSLMRHIISYSNICAETSQTHSESNVQRQVTRRADNSNNFRIECLNVSALDAYLAEMRSRQ